MPTKVRGEHKSQQAAVYTGGTGVDTPFSNEVLFPEDGLYEKIVYENTGKKRFGNCFHEKRVTKMFHTPIRWADGGSLPGGETSYSRISNRAAQLVGAKLPVIPAVDWAQLNAEAYLTMKPSLNSGFSLTNFAAELVELKTMFSLWKRARTVLQNISSGYLNYQFGWKLFLGDVKTIHDTIVGFEKNLADYKSRQGIRQKRHFTKTLPASSGVIEVLSAPYGDRTTYAITQKFFATMVYKYHVPQLESEYAQARAWLDALGVHFDSSVVWEAIPFSFVVDWFVGVGDFLQSKQVDYLDSQVEIIDYCCSVKTEMTCSYDWMTTAVTTQYHTCGSEVRSYYERRRCLPNANDFGVVATDRYGAKQIALSLALLTA